MYSPVEENNSPDSGKTTTNIVWLSAVWEPDKNALSVNSMLKSLPWDNVIWTAPTTPFALITRLSEFLVNLADVAASALASSATIIWTILTTSSTSTSPSALISALQKASSSNVDWPVMWPIIWTTSSTSIFASPSSSKSPFVFPVFAFIQTSTNSVWTSIASITGTHAGWNLNTRRPPSSAVPATPSVPIATGPQYGSPVVGSQGCPVAALIQITASQSTLWS